MAEQLNTPEKVEALIESRPALPAPPAGWPAWTVNTVINGGWTAALAAVVHQLNDGFQVSDLWVIGGTFLHGAAGALVAGDWARSNKVIVIGLGALQTTLEAGAMKAMSGQPLEAHDMLVAVCNGVAFAATAFQKRADEKS